MSSGGEGAGARRGAAASYSSCGWSCVGGEEPPPDGVGGRCAEGEDERLRLRRWREGTGNASCVCVAGGAHGVFVREVSLDERFGKGERVRVGRVEGEVDVGEAHLEGEGDGRKELCMYR